VNRSPFSHILPVMFAALLFYSQHAQAAVPTPQVWFGMGDVRTPEKRYNWERIFFTSESVWPAVLNHVQVISATEQVLNLLPDNDLAKVITKLNQHHLRLSVAVLAQNWVHEPKCGFNVEGYSDPAPNARLAAKLLQAGAQISYLSMDEPLYFGHYYNGQDACHSSIDNIAGRVSIILHEYLKIFPDAEIIDTEPFPGISNQSDWRDRYKEWILTLHKTTGRSMAGLTVDINWQASWEQSLISVAAFARSLRLPLGIIYWASPKVSAGTIVSNDLWVNSAVDNFTKIESIMGIVPDRAVFASWTKFPGRSITDQNGLGEDYLVNQYLDMKTHH
jgi:hypothetical protein